MEIDKGNKAEHLKQQHEELCPDFQSYRVCPRGARCQRIHLYQHADIEQTATMLDYIIGHLHDQAIKLSVIQEQVNGISESLKLDAKRSTERGRARGGAERKRYTRQMRARSASSERASRGTTPGPKFDEPGPSTGLQVSSQPFYPRPQIPSAVGVVYNPRQVIPIGADMQYHNPYYFPHPTHLQGPSTRYSPPPPP
uniref:C3H1-type domain-containing protein n=1 Tax=Macrotermes subhyalinus lispivirus 1 TaxID=3133482 RepID=A0AAT9JF59_9MONO